METSDHQEHYRVEKIYGFLMIYKNYTCILPNFLSVEEVSYIHGYAQQIDTMNSRVGGGQLQKIKIHLKKVVVKIIRLDSLQINGLIIMI